MELTVEQIEKMLSKIKEENITPISVDNSSSVVVKVYKIRNSTFTFYWYEADDILPYYAEVS